MSKYIKLEDAINKMDEWFCEPYTPTELLSDLPTIEVSEDCTSKAYLEQELEHYILTEREVKTDIDLGWNMAFDRVFDVIDNAPSEVPSRAEGEWQITDAYPHNVYCSECHKRFAQTHWAVWEDGSLPRNYCPNCGAKMKG